MRVALLYLRIVKKSDPNFPVAKDYGKSTERFVKTYLEHQPREPHELVVANCGGYRPDSLFIGTGATEFTAMSRGYDCGTYIELNATLKWFDLVVAMNTHVWFNRSDWLSALIGAAQFHGPGVYAPTASFEINPHLRTPCIAYCPGILAQYPHRTEDRIACCMFEHGPDNFGLWAHKQGYPSMMVTADRQCWSLPDWRKPPNIFRRGDQSAVLVRDRHVDLYEQSTPGEKAIMERGADRGKN